jgi:hypothetical protein
MTCLEVIPSSFSLASAVVVAFGIEEHFDKVNSTPL